jgi:hypothetical protein
MRPIVAMAVLALAASVASAQQVKETAHVVIKGGPNAGTYDASSERGGCSYGLSGPGSWGNQLSAPRSSDPKAFNSLQLIVPDAKKAAAGTHEFLITFGFGPLLHRSAEYKVETRAGQPATGSGVVTVHDQGATGSVDFDVTTKDGVNLKGLIECKSVLRAGN